MLFAVVKPQWMNHPTSYKELLTSTSVVSLWRQREKQLRRHQKYFHSFPDILWQWHTVLWSDWMTLEANRWWGKIVHPMTSQVLFESPCSFPNSLQGTKTSQVVLCDKPLCVSSLGNREQKARLTSGLCHTSDHRIASLQHHRNLETLMPLPHFYCSVHSSCLAELKQSVTRFIDQDASDWISLCSVFTFSFWCTEWSQ